MNRAEELRTLANLYIETGDYETALEFARRALMIQERAVGQNSLSLAPLIYDLSLIHAALDHDGQARNLMARLYRFLPAGHPLLEEADLIALELDRTPSAA